MRGERIAATLVAFVGFGGVADLARAQVFIDPDSPTGKEYEIPLETVRRGAEPGTDPSAPIPQGERSAVPFGEGIGGESPDEDSPGAGSGAGRKNGGAGGTDGKNGGRDPASRASRSEIIEAAANNPGAPPSSTGSTLLYVGAGALVLALGAGVGVILRRRRA